MKKIFLSFSFFFSGCAYHHSFMMGPQSLGEKEIPIATVMGESSSCLILGIGTIGNDSIASAIENARLKSGGDALINVFVEKKTMFFPTWFLPIIVESKTIAYGTSIKYTTKVGHLGVKETPFIQSPQYNSPVVETP